MRIGFFASSIIPSTSANSVQVMHMAEAFAGNGHDVTLFATLGDTGEDPFAGYGVAPNFQLERAPRIGGWPLRPSLVMARQVAQAYARHDFDVLYSRRVRFLLALAGLGVPLIHEAHYLPTGAALRIRELLFRLPNFEALVTISAALKEDYLKAFPSLDPSRVVVAHDAATAIPLDAPLTPWPGRADALQFGYVGGVYPGRGADTVCALAHAFDDVDFHVVGGTEEALAPLRAPGVPANLFLHGRVPHVDVCKFYAGFDAVLAPYQGTVGVHGGGGDIGRWMSPLKVFEYMSTGRPILCTDLPVLREVLRHRDNAYMVPSGSLEDWTTAVAEVISDAPLRASLGRAAQRDFEEHYTWAQRARAVLPRELP